MTTTPEGVESEGSLSRDDAAAQFLSRWSDADKPSEDDEGAKPPRRTETVRKPEEDENQSEDDDLDLDEDEDQNEDDDEGNDTQVEASDEALVKLLVDGEEIKIPVKDLKRLYGQEASLTRKSQEVAQQRKQAEDDGARYVTATSRLLDKAKTRFEPYAQIDWNIAAKTLENDEYVALRQEAKAAFEDIQFLNQELDGVFTQAQKDRETALAEQAKATIEVLTGEGGIPNFSPEVYESMQKYAETQGLPLEQFANVIDPASLKILHKAMAYDRAKERAATKRKAAPTSKRSLQSNRRPSGRVGDKAGDQLQKLKQTGSRDDAAAAFLARWEGMGDD